MKTGFKLFCVLSLIWCIGGISGCGKDSPLTEQEKVTAKLIAGSWQNPTVTVDGIDYSDIYKDFEITFTRTTYTTTAGAPIWSASGTWKFKNTEATLLEFDDELEVEIKLISNDLLEIEFQWNENTFEPGRINSIEGKNKFTLNRKR